MVIFQWYNNINILIFLIMISNCLSTISGYIPISGKGKMYYEQNGEGEPLIFIHGHSLDTRMWDLQWDYFSKYFHVIRPDFRGYGKSTDQSETFQFTHVDDLITLMDFLKIDKAHIVGLSMGAFIAGDMLAIYPERMLSCTLTSGGIRSVPGPSEPMGEEEKRRRDSEIEELKKKGIEIYKKEWHKILMSSGGSKRERMSLPLYHMVKDWSAWQQLHKEVRNYYAKEAWDELKRKGMVDGPTLLIRGENDVKYNVREPNEMQYLSNSRFVIIKDCGHMLNMERPDEYNELLLSFLKEVIMNTTNETSFY